MNHFHKKPNISNLRALIPTALFFLSGKAVLAAEVTLPESPAKNFTSSGSQLPSEIINRFITPFLSILSFITVLYMFLAGLKYIRSRGDPKSAAEARARMIFAVFGLVIMILSLGLSQLIDKLILNSGTF